MTILRAVLQSTLVSTILLSAACSNEERQTATENASAEKPLGALVVASNYPLYFFASRIAEGIDGRPEIVFPDVVGDPALWTPSAEQIQLLQAADLVLLNGAGAESWLNLMTLDQRRLRDTTAAIASELIPLNDSIQHQHGPEGEHSHQGTAFTTWLDPTLAIAQAQSITSALIELSPLRAEQYQGNMAQLEQELGDLDAQLKEVFARFDGRPVLFSHPVYQYLQRRYSINGQSVHWEPDEEPSTPDWIELQQILSKHPATVMIWEHKPLETTARRLSNADIKSVEFHTVANRPGEGDYFSAMRDNARQIEESVAWRRRK
jgi:zinc transport system substrate-binding protein